MAVMTWVTAGQRRCCAQGTPITNTLPRMDCFASETCSHSLNECYTNEKRLTEVRLPSSR